MAFTEFYCQSGGDNLNAGSTTSNTAAQTYAGGTFVRATGVFTVASGDPSADGVTVGDFASIYTTAGATVATFVGRVTARDTTTITVSLTAISGATSTVSETAAAATCKVGGAWKGPNGATTFPTAFATSAMTNSSGDQIRINLKNDAEYDITASLSGILSGTWWEGYSSTVGDGGRAVIDGQSNAVILFKCNSGSAFFYFIEVKNGDWGFYSTTNSVIYGCVAHNCTYDGFQQGDVRNTFIECEAYSCRTGFNTAYASTYIRCRSHANTVNGFYADTVGTWGNHFTNCIAYGNTEDGFKLKGYFGFMRGCDSYANGGDGLDINAAEPLYLVENCNFVGNTGYGIQGNSGVHTGLILNCGFTDNTAGATNALDNLRISGTVTYGAGTTPWVDPANGDFRINLAAAKGAGRGTFVTTESGESSTTGYPDIGAAQHVDAGGGGLLTHPGMVGGIRG